jgi:hypothetical protein
MSGWLRLLGIVVLAVGVGAGSYAATRALGDTAFAEVSAQYERHPENWAIQVDYYPAAVRHYGMIAGAVAGIGGGLVFGSLLLGVGTLVARRPDAS